MKTWIIALVLFFTPLIGRSEPSGAVPAQNRFIPPGAHDNIIPAAGKVNPISSNLAKIAVLDLLWQYRDWRDDDSRFQQTDGTWLELKDLSLGEVQLAVADEAEMASGIRHRVVVPLVCRAHRKCDQSGVAITPWTAGFPPTMQSMFEVTHSHDRWTIIPRHLDYLRATFRPLAAPRTDNPVPPGMSCGAALEPKARQAQEARLRRLRMEYSKVLGNVPSIPPSANSNDAR